VGTRSKALSQLRPRILMADGVGLGKTIEVGVLLTELIRRGRGQRILVVALKSILAQFQAELWARFTIPLVRLDTVGIQRVQRDIPSSANPFHHYDRVIVSIDTLKKDARYRRYLDDCHWDAVVIDECQSVAHRGKQRSQRARLARMLARNADALILTSATPHDGSKQSFASLMRLLEPTSIADDTSYTGDQVKHLFVRRFQRDVRGQSGSQFHQRDPQLLRVAATPEEDAVFQALAEVRFRTIGKRGTTDGLFREMVVKSWLSSPAAAAATLERRRDKLRKRNETPEVLHDLEAIDDLLAKIDQVPAEQAKLTRLFTFLDELGYRRGKPGKRVVLFTERVDTMRFLRDAIRARYGLGPTQPRTKDGKKWKQGPVATFSGGQPDQEQFALIQDFNNANGTLRLLIGTDAASEGLNLHHACHHMVHYDIPWSLITLEQRNGRIDRFGQTDAPVIRYLLTVPGPEALQGDIKIITRLVEKETEASDTLGDVAWLLNLHSAEAEERRIAEAIADGEAPEEVLRDADEVDDDDDDWLQDFADDEEDDDVPAIADVETTAPLTLYADDLAFAKEAFTHLGLLGANAKVDWLDEMEGFRLRLPDDLQLRYSYLPPELTDDRHGELKLTADRERVSRAYARARDTEDGWPEWELWWGQHPVADWLTDRVLASFARHEAPLIEVHTGLPPGATALVFQSTLSNNRSQPVHVDWSAIVRRPGEALVREPFEDLAAAIRLTVPVPNTGRELPKDAERLLGPAVDMIRDHLRGWKRTYETDARERLVPQIRALRTWRSARKDPLRKAHSLARKATEKRRIEDELQHVDKVYAARNQWITDCIRCDAPPYIRLAAVLVRPA
jgi:superfamily II DNA or RNA helicase